MEYDTHHTILNYLNMNVKTKEHFGHNLSKIITKVLAFSFSKIII